MEEFNVENHRINTLCEIGWRAGAHLILLEVLQFMEPLVERRVRLPPTKGENLY